ncbi:Rap1a/Tai family immunity protein [Stutzerimonas stutzeri]|uniref:Rap1a/Tai family immunity protein n=1 Tax=Stutzerimonas stutzeri TaxID=316 RepID=UPI003C798EB7
MLPVIYIALLFYSSQSTAATASHFLKSCKLALQGMSSPESVMDPKDSLNSGYCLGVVKGVKDSALIWGWKGSSSTSVCIPEEGVSTEKVIKLTIAFIEENKEILKSTEDTTVTTLALHRSFPCAQ